MAVRKNQVNIAIVTLFIALVTLIVADDLVLRITAGVMMVLSVLRVGFEYLPLVSKAVLRNIWWNIVILLVLAIAISDIFSTKNLVWHYLVVAYLIISVAAYAVKYIQINESFSIKIRNISPVDILIWVIATIVVLRCGYFLFVTDTPFLPYKYSLHFHIPFVLFIIISLGALIYTSNMYIKIGYIIFTVSTILLAVIYFNVLPVEYLWPMFVVYLCTLVVTVPLLVYRTMADYPRFEGIFTVAFLMCIIKGTEVCAKLPEVWEHIQPLFNG